MINLRGLQVSHEAWMAHNFPDRESYYLLLGAMEELGELAHAHLKNLQGIRGDEAQHLAAARDAVGDIIIYLIGYCSEFDWDIEDIITETWAEVQRRDWAKAPLDGMSM